MLQQIFHCKSLPRMISHLGLILLIGRTAFAEEQMVQFNRDIRPILADRCFHCHGPDEADREADLRLDRFDERTAEVLGVSAADTSELINRITSTDADVVMPPPDSHKKKLKPSEVELIRRWIQQGGNYEAYWAFTKVERPKLPKVEHEAWRKNPIDRFVVRKQETAGLSPSAKADRRTLIRRIALDLTGLPPTREAIESFLTDDSSDAYEKVVNQYLDSPQYGEHMARYWLDVVRFADTNGIHHDHYRDLTPYRTWVIESFNRNLPYDVFVRDQIAGDLLENPSTDELIASGFNRLHMIIDRGTMLPEESLARNVIDRVTAVGTAFMGLTVGCAVCHDHKYDPITSKEFYQLYAFFNNLDATPETGGRSGTDFERGLQPPYINLPSVEQQASLDAVEMRRVSIQAELKSLKDWLAANPAMPEKAKETEGDSAKEVVAADDPESQRQAEERRKRESEIAERSNQVKSLEVELKQQNAARDQLLREIPAAMVMKERTERRPSHLMIRGAYDNLGEEVQRDTPAFLPPMDVDGVASRLDFARWLISRDQPLTARVTVNRFWQQLFGVGLVKTSEDLGAQGEWPSHPDLLNYLAAEFMDSGWDVKALIKQMVMSNTYQQHSEAAPESFQRDPENRWLTRGSRYRLDAEVIRDQMLAVSGLLKHSIGGKSVKPPQPDGLWQSVALPSSFPNRFVADEGDKMHRRSVYTFWKRGLPPPQMTIFNAPAREECVARRERTNTPLQALLLMNERQAMDAARSLAVKLTAENDTDPLIVLYETVTGRLPDDSELASLQQALNDFEDYYSKNPELANQLVEPEGDIGVSRLAAWTMLVNAVLNLDIAKTRS
ncbi:DUF1553 domain-containing protein [Rhodopirellula sp.]|nr:DUF1553 domain-containing protein [Rhodopirellula sp.]